MGGLIDAIASNIFKVAPLLAGSLTSPLSGMALSILASAFGVSPSKLADLLSKITSEPDAPARLAKLEAEHCEALAHIASTDFNHEIDDRKDARTYGKDYRDFLKHMAYLITAGFFTALFLLFIPIDLSSDEKNLLSMLVGMLASKWQTIMDFFYGSSRPQANHGGLIK
jgi:hypothetical protein